MNKEESQGHIRLRSNLIGVPEVVEPIDDDMAIIVDKSQGHMMIPCLLIQILREIRHVKERLAQVSANPSNNNSNSDHVIVASTERPEQAIAR